MSSIEIRGIRKRFGGVCALDGFDLTVRDGEFLTVLGPEASGKSTLLRILAGLEQPDAGAIHIGGQTVLDTRKGVFTEAADRHVGLVFGSGALWPHMSVYNNVAFGLGSKGYTKREIKGRVMEILENLGIARLAGRVPGELTGPECQRAAVARALAGGPRTILIDGLLPGIDREHRVALRGDLKRLHRDMGLTVLFATRDQEEALTISTRVAVIGRGRLIQEDSPIALYQNPCNLSVARKIGDPQINLIPAKAQVDGGLMTVQSVLGIHQFTRESFTEDAGDEALFDCAVGLRPELISIGGEPGPGAVGARVYSCQPSGSETIVQLLADGQPLLVKCLGIRFFRADQQVYLSIRPEALNVFHLETEKLIKTAALPVLE